MDNWSLPLLQEFKFICANIIFYYKHSIIPSFIIFYENIINKYSPDLFFLSISVYLLIVLKVNKFKSKIAWLNWGKFISDRVNHWLPSKPVLKHYLSFFDPSHDISSRFLAALRNSLIIAELGSQYIHDFTQISAAGVIACIPPFILVLIFQKFIVSGLTMGDVKE